MVGRSPIRVLVEARDVSGPEGRGVSVDTRRMTARLLWLLCALCLLAVPVTAAAQVAGPEWSLAPLPGGRVGLLPRLGLSPDLPAALAVGEIIRVAHGTRDTPNPALTAVRGYFAAPPPGNAEPLPLPLAPAAWRDLLGGDLTDATLLAAVIQDRRAALLCYGLLQLDRETLAAVASNRGLLRRMYERHTGVLAGFGQAIRVHEGRLILPGGDAAALAWSELLGEPVTDLPRAIDALLGKDDGRLIYFADTLGGLDAPHLAMTFGTPDDEDAIDRTRDIYDAFKRIESGWAFGESPFVRLGADPALLLPALRLDAAGRLRHTKAFWESVLSERRLPPAPTRRAARLDDDERVEAGWLLERLTGAALPARLERALVYHFAERLTDRLPGASAADVAWLARAYRQYPALLLALERLDVVDAGVFKAMATRGRAVMHGAGDSAALEHRLALFQAPLMLVTRAMQAQAIDADRARALVASLAGLDPERAGYGRAVAEWISGTLLPALGHDPEAEGASAEGTLLEALAGLRAPVDPATPATLTWEAHRYRIDAAAPALVRLTEVRGLQAGNTLDQALALSRAGGDLAGAGTVAEVQAVITALKPLGADLVPLEASERTTAPPPPDIRAAVDGTLRDLARVRTSADLKRAAAAAGRLGRFEEAVLADVLTSILYALWLGDPQGQAFLAGNVARRHDFGVHLLAGSDREAVPWQLPVETSGDGEPWHLRGALLGLDVGLARLALHRTRLDLPEDQPTLNESDRRTLMLTLALTSVADLDQAGADRLAAWLQAGRAVAARPDALAARLEALDLDGRRQQAVLWAAAHAPDSLPRLLMRTELVLLGRDTPDGPGDAWGMAQTPRTGCLCLQFPAPPAVHRVSGRAGSGLLTSRIADLTLRVLERLHELALPAVLARGVLASALHDYLDDVRPVHGDDWWTLVAHVDRVPPERFDDYISALTAGGPLVPLEADAPATNGHE